MDSSLFRLSLHHAKAICIFKLNLIQMQKQIYFVNYQVFTLIVTEV